MKTVQQVPSSTIRFVQKLSRWVTRYFRQQYYWLVLSIKSRLRSDTNSTGSYRLSRDQIPNTRLHNRSKSFRIATGLLSIHLPVSSQNLFNFSCPFKVCVSILRRDKEKRRKKKRNTSTTTRTSRASRYPVEAWKFCNSKRRHACSMISLFFAFDTVPRVCDATWRGLPN